MINALCKQAFDNATEKGFYEDPPRPLERHMLIVTEIAEASEEARKGTPPVYKEAFTDGGSVRYCEPGTPGFLPPSKPEGELVELADACIRIFDYCGSRGWDLEAAIEMKMEYNKSRPHKHGKLK